MPFDGKLMPPGVVLRNHRQPEQDPATAAAVRNYRRSSLAATLHANLISFGGHPDAFDVARRRLSNVGDVVSRQISRTIGWRSVSANVELIVSQGKSLCSLYIQGRLKRSGIYQHRLGLRRMRSAKLLQGGEIVDEVYPTLAYVGAELERMHPDKHERVARQMGVGSFKSEQHVAECITLWAKFKYGQRECNWSDVISLFAVAGGCAVDCVRQGNPEFLPGIVKGVSLVLDEDIGFWIHNNGGWIALALRYRVEPKQREWQTHTVALLIAAATILLIVILGASFCYEKSSVLGVHHVVAPNEEKHTSIY